MLKHENFQNDSIKFIDLSVPINPNFWEPNPVFRKIISHKEGGDLLGRPIVSNLTPTKRLRTWIKNIFKPKVTHRDFPNGKGLSLMQYFLSTHTGTHLDAPFHYSDVDYQGMPAKTITDIPLEWCFGKGVLINIKRSQQNCVQLKEVTDYLRSINYDIQPFDIVLIKTGSDQYLGKQAYFTQYRGVSREVIEYLVDKGVKVIGIDSFSFDPPFQTMLQDYLATHDKKYLWPAHMYGREKEYCQLERLTNLNQLMPYHSFNVSCFPIKLQDADAAWCRVVAIINKPIN